MKKNYITNIRNMTNNEKQHLKIRGVFYAIILADLITSLSNIQNMNELLIGGSVFLIAVSIMATLFDKYIANRTEMSNHAMSISLIADATNVFVQAKREAVNNQGMSENDWLKQNNLPYPSLHDWAKNECREEIANIAKSMATSIRFVDTNEVSTLCADNPLTNNKLKANDPDIYNLLCKWPNELTNSSMKK